MNTFSILNWNDSSPTVHDKDLKYYMFTFYFVVRVICIQETWFRTDITFTIPNYTAVRQDRPGYVHGGGCAILYPIKTLISPYLWSVVPWRFAFLFFLSLVNLYHSKSSFVLTDFDSILSQLPSPLVLCGDCNKLWGSEHLDSKEWLLVLP